LLLGLFDLCFLGGIGGNLGSFSLCGLLFGSSLFSSLLFLLSLLVLDCLLLHDGLFGLLVSSLGLGSGGLLFSSLSFLLCINLALGFSLCRSIPLNLFLFSGLFLLPVLLLLGLLLVLHLLFDCLLLGLDLIRLYLLILRFLVSGGLALLLFFLSGLLLLGSLILGDNGGHLGSFLARIATGLLGVVCIFASSPAILVLFLVRLLLLIDNLGVQSLGLFGLLLISVRLLGLLLRLLLELLRLLFGLLHNLLLLILSLLLLFFALLFELLLRGLLVLLAILLLLLEIFFLSLDVRFINGLLGLSCLLDRGSSTTSSGWISHGGGWAWNGVDEADWSRASW